MLTRRELAARVGLLAAAGVQVLPEAASAQRTPFRKSAPTNAVWLNANEYPEAPPEAVVRAMSAALPISNRYRYQEMPNFQAMLARSVDVAPDHVMFGAGSTEVLNCAVHAFTSPELPLVVPDPTYEDPAALARSLGRAVIRVPLQADYGVDVRGLAAEAQKAGGGMIYFCNPNNPTSAATSHDDVAWLVKHLPANTVLLVDEAYIQFADATKIETALDHVRQGMSVIVTRTFSKIYGMAGVRAGFGCARPDLIKQMEPYRTLIEFDTATPSIITARGVLAALAEAKTLLPVRKARVLAVRDEICAWFRRKGLHYIPPQASFVMIDVGRDARPLISEMARRGVVVGRPFPPLDHMMRVSIGTGTEMARFRDVFWSVYNA